MRPVNEDIWNSAQSRQNFQRNCQALESRAPELAKQLRAEPSPLESLEPLESIGAQRSRDGHWVLFYRGKPLYSRYRPLEECKRWVDLHKETNAAIFAGFGLGYQIEVLLNKRSKALVLVVESSFALFKAALCLRDLSTLLSNPKFFCSVGPSANLELYLHHFSERNFQFFQLQPLFQLQQEFYRPLQARILNLLKRFRINSNTLNRFGQLWVKNIAMNMSAIVRSRDAGQFYGHFDKLPFLLVAAGPSLEQILPAMHQLRKRFVIISVDTALSLLLKEGIQPDFVLSVDPQLLNSRHFDHCHAPDSILIAESCVYPNILQKGWRSQALFHSSFPLMERIEQQLAKAGRFAKVRSGGSVATAAWDFARNCKAQSLYVAGLDLSYPTLRSHCPGTLSQRQSLLQGNRLQPVEHINWRVTVSAGVQHIESWQENHTVLSDKRMSVYRNWLEEGIKSNPHWPNYAIDGKAKIEGMQLSSLEEALREPERRMEIEQRISSALQKPSVQEPFAQEPPTQELSQQNEHLYQTVAQVRNEIRDIYRWSAEILTLLCHTSPQKTQAKRQSELQAKISKSPSRNIVSFFFTKSLSQMAGRSPEQEEDDQGERDRLQIYQNFYLSSKFHLYWLELALRQLQ